MAFAVGTVKVDLHMWKGVVILEMRTKAAAPARNSQAAKVAVPPEELRRRFVNVSQRIGLLLARYERSVQWTHTAAKQDELLQELETERRDLERMIRSLWDEKFRRVELASWLKRLVAAAMAAEGRVNALKNEGAS